jgi:hypothetical protein
VTAHAKWWARFFGFRLLLAIEVLCLLAVAGWLVADEMRTSAYQARFFASLAGKATYTLGAGPSPSMALALIRNDPGLLTCSDPPAMGGKSTAGL